MCISTNDRLSLGVMCEYAQVTHMAWSAPPLITPCVTKVE